MAFFSARKFLGAELFAVNAVEPPPLPPRKLLRGLAWLTAGSGRVWILILLAFKKIRTIDALIAKFTFSGKAFRFFALCTERSLFKPETTTATTFPDVSRTGPPLFPPWMAASIWIRLVSSPIPASELTIPFVTFTVELNAPTTKSSKYKELFEDQPKAMRHQARRCE